MNRTRISPALREDYLHWLEAQLKDEHSNTTRSYWDLVTLMFDTEFTLDFDGAIAMDRNRVVDGKDLRMEYSYILHGSNRRQLGVANALLAMGPISFLEVLIGLSRRLAFVAGGSAPGWAWQLLGNLELHRMWDNLSVRKQRKVIEIMDVAIKRTYAPDGSGGFFPLAWTDDDQTRIELWYQLNSYVEELHPEH